jgi:hypothetical protein
MYMTHSGYGIGFSNALFIYFPRIIYIHGNALFTNVSPLALGFVLTSLQTSSLFFVYLTVSFPTPTIVQQRQKAEANLSLFFRSASPSICT